MMVDRSGPEGQKTENRAETICPEVTMGHSQGSSITREVVKIVMGIECNKSRISNVVSNEGL